MRVLPLALLAYLVFYILFEWSGFFAAEPPPLRTVLMSDPMLAAAVALLAVVLASAFKNIRSLRFSHWLGLASISLVIIGMLVSYLTAFETEITLTEGQSYVYETDKGLESGYSGRFSGVKNFILELKKAFPDINDSGNKDGPTTGVFYFQTVDMESPEMINVSEKLPMLEKGMLLRIEEFGYSPLFIMKRDGREIDGAFVSLKLYPYGSEDYFRSLSPHTFYLRYQPGHMVEGEEKPLLVRIARNKDLIYNGAVNVKEGIHYGDVTISFEELRMWTKVSVRRDFGIPISLAGVIAGCLFGITWLVGRRKHRG